MKAINGKIEYALRDEILNIFAMTYGEVPAAKSRQIMICKKKKFTTDRLGPFLLDPKRSKATYTKSQVGIQYEEQVEDKVFELKYIAFVEDQIEIKPSLELFQELKIKGIFSLWEAEAPFKYFEGNEKGYLILFRVYQLEKEIDEKDLEKGRSGRNYYYGLTQATYYDRVTPVIDDETYYNIKNQLLHIVHTYKRREENKALVYVEPQEEIGLDIPKSHVSEGYKYDRDQKVSAYVKKRANGYCECCGRPAPFIKDNGEAYLEEHHLVPLSKGGTDRIENVCAVCPNCHRELHYGVNREVIKQRIQKQLVTTSDLNLITASLMVEEKERV